MMKRGTGTLYSARKHTTLVSSHYTVVLSLEDDIVEILLFEDSGDKVIPSGSGRSLEDDAICFRILVMSFLQIVVTVKLKVKWNSVKNVVSTQSRDV
jgi:hypothetical protein